jgi:TRAP-type C4-dicarboxylate transport system permease small subunit
MLKKSIDVSEKITKWLAIAGGLIILVQMIWISIGVFKRYVLGNPDGYVTEATALLLFPVAFLGLAFALKENAYPTVTFAVDALKGKSKRFLLSLNFLTMLCVGIFFSVAAVDATLKSYASGSASEILLWPRYFFWIPCSISFVVFTWYAFLRFLSILIGQAPALSDSNKES